MSTKRGQGVRRCVYGEEGGEVEAKGWDGGGETNVFWPAHVGCWTLQVDAASHA